MISIIIPIVKENKYFQDLMTRLDSNMTEDYEIIVLDDPGYTNAKWNEGASLAQGEYLWFLNDDIVLTKGLDKLLIDALKECNIACPNTTRGKDKWKMPILNNKDMINGWCFMMKKEDFIPIPESLKLWYGDNWLYEQTGKSVLFAGLCHHFESVSIKDKTRKEEIELVIAQDNINWKLLKSGKIS